MKLKKASSVKNNIFVIKMIWRICPLRVMLTYLSTLLDFAAWTFYTVVFMRYLFGDETAARTFEEAVTFVWLVVAVNLVYYLFGSWYRLRFVPLSNIKIHYALNRKLFEKASEVDISCYESPEFYNSYTKATVEAYDRGMSVLSNTATIVSAFLSSVYVMCTMYSISVYSVLFAVFPLIGNLVFGKRLSKIEYERNQADIPYRRRYDYVNRAVYLRKYSGDIRMTQVFYILKEIYSVAYDGVVGNIKKFSNAIIINGVARDELLYPLTFQGMWFVGAYLAIVKKQISLGDFVVLSSAVVSATWMVRNFSDALTNSYRDSAFIENLKTFLDYKPRINENQTGKKADGAVNTIEVRDVSFKYDGQERWALKNISLLLKTGEKVAVVGLNGSGKSTLVKLLMRLYDPTEGQILLNDTDIRDYDLHSYRMLIGTTFQDFAIFSASVLENVAMNGVKDDRMRAAATAALKESGVLEKCETLKNGVDTTLTREFDDSGAVLSGGEYQKIAVARAFAKASPIVILDEPSSALDPIAEYSMYETILKLCDKCDPEKGKISIIISHRLSSAVLADRIFVLDNACLVEAGTHADLIMQGGLYSNMFKKQAESYLQDIEAAV